MPILPGLADSVASLSLPQTIFIDRRSGASYDADGRPVPGTLTTLSTTGLIQPASQRDLERLPEGDRTRDPVRIHLREQIRTSQDATGNQADVVRWTPAGGSEQRYVATAIGSWNDIGGYWNGLLIREGTS